MNKRGQIIERDIKEEFNSLKKMKDIKKRNMMLFYVFATMFIILIISAVFALYFYLSNQPNNNQNQNNDQDNNKQNTNVEIENPETNTQTPPVNNPKTTNTNKPKSGSSSSSGSSGSSGTSGSSVNTGGGCTPDCSLKTCGDDSCGGSCGTCDYGQTCNNGNCEEQKMVGIFLNPRAYNYSRNGVYTNFDHSIYIQDFSDLVDTLKIQGFNTMVFDMHFWSYNYGFDNKLHSSIGFNSTEVNNMVRIARNKGMKVIPSIEVLSHQGGGILSQAYPQYMLIGSNGDVRDPFNVAGEQKVFGMIDELINSFTVDSKKPEAFHITTDELSYWVNCTNSLNCNGMNESGVFATAITNVYNHIKQNNPDMKVIMWGDMLDEKNNGGNPLTPVAGAVNLIPKEIIIDDWKYDNNKYYGYDFSNKTFPSVGKFMDQGHDVIVSPWQNIESTIDLIWTGKKEDLRTNKFNGVIYTDWVFNSVPSLNHALTGLPLNWMELINDPASNNIVLNVSKVIKNTSTIIGLNQCRGIDDYCGTYPECEDCNSYDNYYNGTYRNYYCENNQCKYNVLDFPTDHVAYWKFENNLFDEKGRYNGTKYGNTNYVNGVQGQALYFDGNNDYVDMGSATNLRINHIGNQLTIGAWVYFKGCSGYCRIGGFQGYFGDYALWVDGSSNKILFEVDGKNNNNLLSYDPIDKQDWHYVTGTFDSLSMKIYIDGSLKGEIKPLYYPPNEGINNLMFGNKEDSWFNGSIDEVMIYNRSLSPGEVRMIYNNGLLGIGMQSFSELSSNNIDDKKI